MTGIYHSVAGGHEILRRYRELLTRWPVAYEQVTVPTCQGDTSAIISGPADAPPLLLLHGSGTNSAMWMGDISLWAEHFRVHAIDLIGEPGLSHQSRPPLTSDAYSVWLDDVLDGLGLTGTVSIVGASLGGWMALDYASRRPGRVERLALLCPGGIGRQKGSFALKAMLLMMFGPWGMRRTLTLAMGKDPSASGRADDAYLDYAMTIFKHFKPRMAKLPVFPDDALQALAMPVLVIVGGRDAMLDSHDTRRRVEQTTPNATVSLLPDAGHRLLGQAAAILHFLRHTPDATDRSPST